MNLIKIFRTSSKEIVDFENNINVWAEENDNKIVQIEVVAGESYSVFGNRTEYKEIFFIVLYSKNKVKRDNKKLL